MYEENANPVINIMKIKNTITNQLYVMLYDVSGSMWGTRINVLSLASKSFISTNAPDGMNLGLVEFYNTPQLLHSIVKVDDGTRLSLYSKVPTQVVWGTSIGSGLNLTLDLFDSYTADYNQATIILFSDGEENTPPYIIDILPRILANNKIRVITYALGNQASASLEDLAKQTNGYALFFSLENISDEIAESQKVAASLIDVISSTCDLEIQTIPIANDKISIIAKKTTRSIYIDKGLGKNTIFVIATKDIDKIDVRFTSPSGISYNPGDVEYEISNERVKLTIPKSPEGMWLIDITKKTGYESMNFELSIQVTSETNVIIRRKSLKAVNYPILLKASLSESIINPNKPSKIFADLKRGYDPIIMASVSAKIEKPNGDSIDIALNDDGVGADSIRNDGIYSGYFTDYSVKGRYNVLVTAINNGNAKSKSYLEEKGYRNKLFNKRTTKAFNKSLTIDDFKQVYFFSNNLDSLQSVQPFSRSQNAGAFRLEENFVMDNIPPIRVNDFSIISVDENSHSIDLQWTSAGDDLTARIAKEIQIRADYDINSLIDENNFDSLYKFTEQQVITGSLDPLNGGVKHLIKLSLDDFWSDNIFSLHFAMKTIDHNNNVAPISNTVTATFGVLKKIKILYESVQKFGKQTLSQKYPMNLENNATNGLFIVDMEPIDLKDLKVYFRLPNNTVINEKFAGFKRDEIEGKILLDFEINFSGIWTLNIQRLNIANPRDINFSIKLIEK